jgi:cob(I)alamin adenosyltransferase
MSGRSKIYTRAGDDGTTGVLGPGRISKADPRIEAYGTVDELNAVIGAALAFGRGHVPSEVERTLEDIQHDLFAIGAALAAIDPQGDFAQVVGPQDVERLEQAIDRFDATLEPLQVFILPGGSVASALLHLARTVCRRAERRVVALSQSTTISPYLIAYLNRLGDLLFVVARVANRASGCQDVAWRGLSKREGAAPGAS